jgi:hypothetical protein
MKHLFSGALYKVMKIIGNNILRIAHLYNNIFKGL